MNRIQHLEELGYQWLPQPHRNPRYPTSSAKRTGQRVETSGQVPVRLDGSVVVGKVGVEVSLEDAVKAAELCMVQCFYAAASVAGLHEIYEALRLRVFVNCTPDFTDISSVADGASHFASQLLGVDVDPSIRTEIGVASLPLGAAVVIDAVFKVRP